MIRRKRNFYGFKGVPQGTLSEWFAGTIIVTGEVHVHKGDSPVTFAIYHDGSGFQPAAAIYAENGISRDQALDAAFQLLEKWKTERQPSYLSERLIDEEPRETDHWDGRSWKIDIRTSLNIIRRNKKALKYVHVSIP